MKKIIVSVFPNRLKIEEIIKELHTVGVTNSEISCVYSDKSGHIKDSQSNLKMEEGLVKGAAAGAVIGAIAGLVVANGVIPGLGTLFVAGPLIEVFGLGITGAMATTAAGVATGALAIGIAAALSELGISTEDSMIYEEFIKSGDVVLIIHTASPAIRDILEKYKSSRIGEYHGI